MTAFMHEIRQHGAFEFLDGYPGWQRPRLIILELTGQQQNIKLS
jgi:hypothetical protein